MPKQAVYGVGLEKTKHEIDEILHSVDAEDRLREITPDLTRSQKTKLLAKLDLTILATCWLLYFINCLDRASIGNAGAYGFRRDVGASGNTFNIGVTLFYIAYVTMEVPSNIAMKKVGAHYWLPAAGVLYGVVTLGTAFLGSNRGQFLAIRFLLGLFEGATLPGASYFLSLWYSRDQLTSRLGIFITAAAFSSGVASLLATAYVRAGAITPRIYGWRNIFFINAMMSFAVSIIAVIILPKNPTRFRILNDSEKVFLMGQSAQLTAGRPQEEANRKDLVWRAFKHPSSYFGVLPWFCGQIMSGSFNYFLPELLTTFGWSGDKANTHTAATYFVAVAWILILAGSSHYTRLHFPFIILNLLVGIIGFSLFAYATSNGARYAGSFLCVMSLYGGVGINTAWVGANAQPYTTRSVALAISISLGALGGIVGSWVFIASEADRRFPTGSGLVYAFFVLTIIAVLGHAGWAHWENKQREAGKRDYRLSLPAEEVALLGSLHPSFRYAL